MPAGSARIPGFYNLSLADRHARLRALGALDEGQLAAFASGGLVAKTANSMIENVVGTYNLPLGLALNFLVNGREVLVPMAIEEPSVVAGASFMAKLARAGGGFRAVADEPEMIGQMQLLEVGDAEAAKRVLLEHKEELLTETAGIDPVLEKLGGGPRDLEV